MPLCVPLMAYPFLGFPRLLFFHFPNPVNTLFSILANLLRGDMTKISFSNCTKSIFVLFHLLIVFILLYQNVNVNTIFYTSLTPSVAEWHFPQSQRILDGDSPPQWLRFWMWCGASPRKSGHLRHSWHSPSSGGFNFAKPHALRLPTLPIFFSGVLAFSLAYLFNGVRCILSVLFPTSGSRTRLCAIRRRFLRSG